MDKTTYRVNPYLLFTKLQDNMYLVVNVLDKTCIKCDKELFDVLRNRDVSKIPEDIQRVLYENKILIPKNIGDIEYLESKIYRNSNNNNKITNNVILTKFEFIVTWQCNFSCSYCFENKDKTSLWGGLTTKHVDKAFEFIDQYSTHNFPLHIGLMGGEPLLPSYKQVVSKIFKNVQERNGKITIITNGSTIDKYLDLISKYNDYIERIQVTLDGTRDVHDKRRPFKGGIGSFDKIVSNIDSLLRIGFKKVRIVMNVDHENLDDVPNFIQFLEQKGWLGNFNILITTVESYGNIRAEKFNHYKTSRERIIKKLFEYFYEHPELLRYIHVDDNRGSMRVLYSLIIEGKIPNPTLYHCAGIAGIGGSFSPDGKVYPCAAFAEGQLYPIGEYYPKQKLYAKQLSALRKRNTLNLRKCYSCNLLPICAGGCPIMGLSYEEYQRLKIGKCNLLECTTCLGKEIILEEGVLYYNFKQKLKEERRIQE